MKFYVWIIILIVASLFINLVESQSQARGFDSSTTPNCQAGIVEDSHHQVIHYSNGDVIVDTQKMVNCWRSK
jgi:hypothetical protein